MSNFQELSKKGVASTVYLPVEIDTEANPDFYFYGDVHRSSTDESNMAFSRLYGVIPKNTPILIYSRVDNGVLHWEDGEYTVNTVDLNWPEVFTVIQDDGKEVRNKVVGLLEYHMFTEDDFGKGKSYYGFSASSSAEEDINMGDLVKVGVGAYISPFRFLIVTGDV